MAQNVREAHRYYIYIGWKNNQDASQIRQSLVNAEGDNAPSIYTIHRWIKRFEEGWMTFEDKPRSGRPREATTPQKIQKIQDLIKKNPHETTQMLADSTCISRERVQFILYKHLDLKKVCAKWIPHVLTEENKRRRVETSKMLLSLLIGNNRNVITGDETWIHFFTVSNKENNKVWVTKDQSRPTIVKTARNSKKRMFCIFFSVDGVIARIVVPKGKTVTGNLYANEILPKVFKNFKKKRERTTMRDVSLHHDNASSHSTNDVRDFLQQNRVELLPHPPYSPDLAPCDFFLFPRIKKQLGGKKFENVENLARSVQSIVDNILKEDYCQSFQNWKIRLQRCIEVEGNYFEGLH